MKGWWSLIGLHPFFNNNRGVAIMLKPSVLAWVIVIFGVLFIFIPIVYVQLSVAIHPDSQKTKDMIIGRGEDYRDNTHTRLYRERHHHTGS
jgi:hypothetical protein